MPILTIRSAEDAHALADLHTELISSLIPRFAKRWAQLMFERGIKPGLIRLQLRPIIENPEKDVLVPVLKVMVEPTDDSVPNETIVSADQALWGAAQEVFFGSAESLHFGIRFIPPGGWETPNPAEVCLTSARKKSLQEFC